MAKTEVSEKINTQFNSQIEEIKCKAILDKGESPTMPNGEIQKVKKVKINQMTFWAVTKDEKVHFINSENLTPEQLQFISSYVPEYKNDFEVPFSLEDRSLNQENPNIDAFI